MIGDGMLSFREFVMRERLPLASVQAAIMEFLTGREDAALFGAQAVNAYVETARMTEDVDVLSTQADTLAEALRAHLSGCFNIAVRVRRLADGAAYRVYLSLSARARTAKGATDLADLRRLLVALPQFKAANGPVLDRLRTLGASAAAMELWKNLAAQEIPVEEDLEAD